MNPDERAPLTATQSPELSVVIPFYNEEDNADGLLLEIEAVLSSVGQSYEILAVDDGSKDGTLAVLSARAEANPRVSVLSMDRNRGQAAALYHGLRTARAPIIITMDGDGQNDPADIPALLSGLDELDMVVGIRDASKRRFLRRWMSKLANAVRGRLLRDRMRDSGCALKVFRREVVDAFIPMLTLYSFMPALAQSAGFRIGQRKVSHRSRMGGVSSYGLRQFLWRPLLDLIGVCWFIRRRFKLPLD